MHDETCNEHDHESEPESSRPSTHGHRDLDELLGDDETAVVIASREVEQPGEESTEPTKLLMTVRSDVAQIAHELQRIKTDDLVLSEMHDRTRKLAEKFHEREVLLPVFNVLIGIADRGRHLTERARQKLSKMNGPANHPMRLAIKHIVEARDADRLEIENLLAVFGVEPFENPGDRFDPSCQKCIKRAPCDQSRLDQKLAQRLLPGYRRHGQIIRQEGVAVYLCNP